MDEDWDNLPTVANAAPAPVAPRTFGDDDFGGDGFGEAPAAAPAPTANFAGFGEEPAASSGFSGDSGFGDMFGGLAQENVAPAAPIQSTPMDFGGDFAAEPASAPLAAAPAPAPSAQKKTSMFNNAPIVDQVETTALDKWDEEHREVLKKKRLEQAEKKSATVKAAEKAIAETTEQRKKAIEATKKANKDSEAQFLKQRDDALLAGLKNKESWEKVSSYLDLSADPKRAQIVSRMKSILIAVKSHPPAEKRNFGA